MGMIFHVYVNLYQLLPLLQTGIIQLHKNSLMLNTNNLHLVVISYQLAMVNMEGLEVITSLKMTLVQLIVLLL
jgi:hypothetical protein